MLIFSLTVRSNFLNTDVIRTFHYAMFHGRASRGGHEFPHDTSVWVHTEAPEPLKIARTGHNVPEISCPSTHLVVSARVVERLENVPNIRIMPVEFTRLVDIPYAKGDHSWAEHYPHHEPERYLRTLPDIARFHDEIGRYYEVQTYRLMDVVDNYEDVKSMDFQSGTPPSDGVVSVRVSRSALADYPMIYGDLTGAVFVTKPVFDLLEPDIDRDFFIVRSFEV